MANPSYPGPCGSTIYSAGGTDVASSIACAVTYSGSSTRTTVVPAGFSIVDTSSISSSGSVSLVSEPFNYSGYSDPGTFQVGARGCCTDFGYALPWSTDVIIGTGTCSQTTTNNGTVPPIVTTNTSTPNLYFNLVISRVAGGWFLSGFAYTSCLIYYGPGASEGYFYPTIALGSLLGTHTLAITNSLAYGPVSSGGFTYSNAGSVTRNITITLA